jgi:hypothetical protein
MRSGSSANHRSDVPSREPGGDIMLQPIPRRRTAGPAALGMILVIVGAVLLLVRQAGPDILETVGENGWPLFIIVPGLLLLAVAALAEPPRGVAFAISGAIVTTVGSLLWYQQATGNWESWAFAWALLPTAAGVALVVYGALTRHQSFVSSGLWTGGIGALLFAVGAWFFGDVFAGRNAPVDVATWAPVLLIIVGGAIAAASILRPARGGSISAAAPSQGGHPS